MDLQQALDMGCSAYIKKPFKKEGLEAAIAAARQIMAAGGLESFSDDPADEGNYSECLWLVTSPTWGDIVSSCQGQVCKPADGVCGLADILADLPGQRSADLFAGTACVAWTLKAQGRAVTTNEHNDGRHDGAADRHEDVKRFVCKEVGRSHPLSRSDPSTQALSSSSDPPAAATLSAAPLEAQVT